MRSGFPAAVVCLALSLAGVGLYAQSPAPQPTVLPAAATPAVPAASPTTGSDAADRHAKRTACIKDAKTKKLHGPDRTAYIKNCAATP
jgi:psiF repeat